MPRKPAPALVLVGHVTKDGNIAGPRVLEHMVDTVMSFEGERSHQYRILRASRTALARWMKSACSRWKGRGWRKSPTLPSLFLSGREEPIAGSAVFPALEGTRPVLVEVQALIVRLAIGRNPAPRGGGVGQRAAGDAAGGAGSALRAEFFHCEVYLNVAGGYRLTDPAADLAVAAALVSALADKPLPRGCGVVRRTGAVGRSAPGGPCRHCACAKRPSWGFSRAAGPEGQRPEDRAIAYRPVASVPGTG